MNTESKPYAYAVSECPFHLKGSGMCLLTSEVMLPDNAMVKRWEPPSDCLEQERCIEAFEKFYPELQGC